MELWVSGFNAWNQLQFVGDLPQEPEDMVSFRSVLRAAHIELIHASVSSTMVRTKILTTSEQTSLKAAGFTDDYTQHLLQTEEANSKKWKNHITIAGNDQIAEFTPNDVIQYTDFHAYLKKDGHTFPDIPNTVQIVSNQTTFTALSSDGSVHSWGDGRYEACLGRDITGESSASSPFIILTLIDLPTGSIKKLSSGGYVTGALTAGNDLYVWGGRPGEAKILEDIDGEPGPVDVEGKDILDFGVGMNHLIVLTTDGKIFVVGAGGNGQLGIGDKIERVKDWKEVILPLSEKQRVVSVHAGYKNSFVLVEDT